MSWLMHSFIASMTLCVGLVIGQKVEHDANAKTAAALAAHAHDIETVVGVQHCDDTVVGFLVVDKSGAITPHFEPGQNADDINKIMNAAPQHAALRVCTAREQRWN